MLRRGGPQARRLASGPRTLRGFSVVCLSGRSSLYFVAQTLLWLASAPTCGVIWPSSLPVSGS